MTAMVTDGKITRDVVLATALEIIDRDGADALSMRRLARALGRDPMILYRHAPNKAALLEGVAETVLTHLKVDPADPDWAAQLRSVARDYRQLALAHRTSCRCWSPGRWPPRLGSDPRAPAPPGRRPHPAHPRRLQQARRPAHLPGPVRLPARPRPQRVPGTHRQPRRDRRPAAAGPVPAADRRIPPAPQPRLRPGLLRRRRRTRTRPRHPARRADRHTAPPRGAGNNRP